MFGFGKRLKPGSKNNAKDGHATTMPVTVPSMTFALCKRKEEEEQFKKYGVKKNRFYKIL